MSNQIQDKQSATAENKAQSQNEVSPPASAANTAPSVSNQNSATLATNLRPIDTSVKTLQITPTALVSTPNKVEISAASPNVIEAALNSNSPVAALSFAQSLPKMKAGEKTKIPVMIKSVNDVSFSGNGSEI
ncbi:MAG: hypothetical protein WKF71_07915 [Pyrinomonadaceae bacterium]